MKPIKLPDPHMVGELPTIDELNQLAYYYDSYNDDHRKGILRGFFIEQSGEMILGVKFKAKGFDPATMTGQELGAEVKWPKAKAEKAMIRLLYLRYRLKEGCNHIQANQKLYQLLPFPDGSKDIQQNMINKITRTPELP